jgi:hypothetical protein
LEILNDCLEAVLQREKTLAECLALYPAEATWLKSELQTALLLRSLSAPGMPEDAVKTLESRLVRQFNRSAPLPRRNNTIGWVGKWAAGFMVALLMAFGGGTTTVAASANSQPGDTLYTVKRAWENIVVYVATLIGRADEVWLHLAQIRFDEMQAAATKGMLAPEILDEVYGAVQRAIVFADSDTTTPLVVFMMTASSELQLIPKVARIEAQYTQVRQVLEPHFDTAGRLVLLENMAVPAVPPVQMIVASATVEPTITPTQVLPSPTPTFVPVVLASDTPGASPTPTRTPTDTPTATPTITPSFTPTLTWTPLPLPGGTLVTVTPFVLVATNATTGSASPPITPTGALLYPIRPTQLAVYMTQTAIASGEIPTEEVTPP